MYKICYANTKCGVKNMGVYVLRNFPYIIAFGIVILLVVGGADVKKEIKAGNRQEFKHKRRPLFKRFINLIYKMLKEEGIEVSKELIIEVISFCILGGVNPQKISFKEGKFDMYWEWAKLHRAIIMNNELKNPKEVINKILEASKKIGDELEFNVRREYAPFIRIKYMKHVPDIWWFAEVFEKHE